MKLALALAFPLAALAVPAAAAFDQAPGASQTTIVHDAAALQRLRGNSGLTLQWISWDHRGHVRVLHAGGLYTLSGSQTARDGRGRVTIDGAVLAIEQDRFTFHGRIVITDTPDPGRECVRDGTYEFRVTQNRRYWRLQEMEVCDGLTDYVDIYF